MPVYAKLPFIPPSVNHAYFTTIQRPKGKKAGKSVPIRVLTAKGKKFKTEVKTHMARHHQDFMAYVKPNVPYTLIVCFNLGKDELFNSTWPEKTGERYKKYDASNRLKLMEDAICEACGHDDRQHWNVVASKGPKAAEDEPNTEIWLFDLEKESCPVDNWIGQQPR